MSTPIKSTDHDALNAAFAEKVAGWEWESGMNDRSCGWWFDDERQIEPNFTRSADAVLKAQEPKQ